MTNPHSTMTYTVAPTARRREDGFYYPGARTTVDGVFLNWFEMDVPFASEDECKREAGVFAGVELERLKASLDADMACQQALMKGWK